MIEIILRYVAWPCCQALLTWLERVRQFTVALRHCSTNSSTLMSSSRSLIGGRKSIHVPISFTRRLTPAEICELQWPMRREARTTYMFDTSPSHMVVLTREEHDRAIWRRGQTMVLLFCTSLLVVSSISIYGRSVCVGTDCQM